MADEQRRRRRPRRPAAPAAETPAEAQREAQRAPADQHRVEPWQFREHLENVDGVQIRAEPGWPTEIKRYYLVKVVDGKEKILTYKIATEAEAITYFYYYLHPHLKPATPRGQEPLYLRPHDL